MSTNIYVEKTKYIFFFFDRQVQVINNQKKTTNYNKKVRIMTSPNKNSKITKVTSNYPGPPRRSLRFERRLSLQSSGNGGVGYLHRLSNEAEMSRNNVNNYRKSSSLRRMSSRWNRRRTFSRRLSRLPSEDFDEFELLAFHQAGGSFLENDALCFRLISARVQGLLLAIIFTISSFASTVGSSVFILRNFMLAGMSFLLPVNCSRERWSPEEKNKTYLGKLLLSDQSSLINCSSSEFLIWYVVKKPVLNGTSDLPIHGERIVFFNPNFLWFTFGVSLLFLWSSGSLLDGVWSYKRRKLVPWLLVSGISVLFFVMSSVWVFIRSNGLKKLYTLIPTGLGIFLLYCWCVVNSLLEEIHNNKKLDAKVDAEAAVLEAGIRARMEEGEKKINANTPYEMNTQLNGDM